MKVELKMTYLGAFLNFSWARIPKVSSCLYVCPDGSGHDQLLWWYFHIFRGVYLPTHIFIHLKLFLLQLFFTKLEYFFKATLGRQYGLLNRYLISSLVVLSSLGITRGYFLSSLILSQRGNLKIKCDPRMTLKIGHHRNSSDSWKNDHINGTKFSGNDCEMITGN